MLGFKLFSRGLERDFAALAKAGNRLLFVTDAKWQTIEGEPGPDWWTGEDKRGAEPRRLNSKEYNNRLVQDFCGFTDVPRGNVLACWGAHPARSNIRRVITTFDVRTALGVAAEVDRRDQRGGGPPADSGPFNSRSIILRSSMMSSRMRSARMLSCPSRYWPMLLPA